ncbi:transposase domain-containing protein [Streptomyces sp. NRRL S-920]|uniref:transposase domain-containing protein n=1 Tax=Streptomyces sp. NRRL S-920 TaxID=1463921 RepID=UPI003B6333F6
MAGSNSADGCCSPAPYLEVLQHLMEGLCDAGLWGDWRLSAKSSLFRARDRLGSEPWRVLFAARARPLPPSRHEGRGLSLAHLV